MRERSALFLSLLLLPAVARATMVLPLALPDLVDHAEHIAVARVESQAPRWTEDHDAIYTDVTLRVVQPMKGGAKAGDTMVLRREGGVVGGIGMRVYGAAAFAEGEEVLVFLERRASVLWTVGMAQGKMHVALIDGQRMAVRQPSSGLGFIAKPGAQAPAAPPEAAVRPLDEVLAAIAARVAAAPDAPAIFSAPDSPHAPNSPDSPRSPSAPASKGAR